MKFNKLYIDCATLIIVLLNTIGGYIFYKWSEGRFYEESVKLLETQNKISKIELGISEAKKITELKQIMYNYNDSILKLIESARPSVSVSMDNYSEWNGSVLTLNYSISNNGSYAAKVKIKNIIITNRDFDNLEDIKENDILYKFNDSVKFDFSSGYDFLQKGRNYKKYIKIDIKNSKIKNAYYYIEYYSEIDEIIFNKIKENIGKDEVSKLEEYRVVSSYTKGKLKKS